MNIILQFILLVFYFLFILPFSIISRLLGKRYLDLKIANNQNTYWNYKPDNVDQEEFSSIDEPKKCTNLVIKLLLVLKYFLYPQDLFRNNIYNKDKINPKEIYPLW